MESEHTFKKRNYTHDTIYNNIKIIKYLGANIVKMYKTSIWKTQYY